MDKSSEGYRSFSKVLDEILLPIASKNKEDINKVLNKNPTFKTKAEFEVQDILRKR